MASSAASHASAGRDSPSTPAASAATSTSSLAHTPVTGESGRKDGLQMILRIKRKRGQDPVDALVIQQAERRTKRRSSAFGSASSRSALTGNDAAEDGADDQTAKQGTSRGIFRLAETVSLDSFSDPAVARLLHQRISALSQSKRQDSDPSSRPVSPLLSTKDFTPSGSASPIQKSGTVSAPPGRSYEQTKNSNEGSASPAHTSLSMLTSHAAASDEIEREERTMKQKFPAAASMRFRVIQKESPGRLRHSGSTGSLRRKLRSGTASHKPWQTVRKPPEIRSKKEKDAEAVFGRIIDAEAHLDQGKRARSKATSGGRSEAKPDAEMDGLDARFAEMLGDYLKTSNLEPPSDLEQVVSGHKRAHEPDPGDDESDAEDSDDDDYVYDIYYRDMIPSRIGPAGVADTGLQPAAVPGHERLVATRAAIPDSMSMPRVQGGAIVPPEAPAVQPQYQGLEIAEAGGVVAQLEGFFDTDDELELAHDGEGYESYDEGEDEDSNDEDFYRNDYPEQELADDDEFDLGLDESDYDDEGEDPYALSDGSY